MFQITAYHESIDPAGVLQPLTAVQDNTVFTAGDDIRVPVPLPNILGAAGLLEATAALRAQVSSPSLRRLSNLDVAPFDTGLAFSDLKAITMHPMNPVVVTPDEPVNFSINSNPAAATSQYGLIWYGDGPQVPIQGDMFTVRATMDVTGLLGEWVNGNISFTQDLPIGDYDIVGMRCVEATTVAARLSFVGGAWRPGVAAANDETKADNKFFRNGMMGTWGTFNTNTPPTVDILAAAGAITPVIYLDLIPR